MKSGKERKREMVPVRSATPSKPSQSLLHKTEQRMMKVYCENERKVNGDCIYIYIYIYIYVYGWLTKLTYLLTYLLHAVQ
jgi:hypothetical protein